MMKVVYSTIAIGLLAFACQPKEEIDPNLLYGNWENVAPLTDWDMDMVESYAFKDDNTFERSVFYREMGKDKLLGYSLYIKGKYSLVGGILDMYDGVFYTNSDGEYGSFEVLEEVDQYTYSKTADIAFADRGRDLELDFGPCSDFVSAMCISIQRFRRVE